MASSCGIMNQHGPDHAKLTIILIERSLNNLSIVHKCIRGAISSQVLLIVDIYQEEKMPQNVVDHEEGRSEQPKQKCKHHQQRDVIFQVMDRADTPWQTNLLLSNQGGWLVPLM